MAMEDTAGAAGSNSSLPPEVTLPSSQRGQKRGAPDEDDAAGDGAARGSPRRAGGVDTLAAYYMEFVDDEEDLGDSLLGEADDGAPPARQLFEFLRVHPGAARAAAGASATGQEHVDVTLRLGIGPVAGDYRGGTVDTTLILGLGSAAAPGDEDDGRHHFQSHGETATGAALGAASNAKPGFDEGRVRDYMAAALFHEPASEDEFLAYDITMDHCFAATAGDGAAGRPTSGLDLNQPCPSELPEGAPVPVTDTAAVDDDDLEAHVDERGVATATVEQRRRSSTPFVFFSSPVHDVRAPGVLTADSS